MKKSIVTTLLGVAVAGLAVTSASGQGFVNFASYISATFIGGPVTYANSLVPPGKEGQAIGSGFSADLWFSIGSGGSAVTGYATTTTDGSLSVPYFGVDGDLGSGAGYFQGPTVKIPGYSSGSITFVIEAFNGASYDTSLIRGKSAPFTLNAIATGNSPVGDFIGSSLSGFTVTQVPEPTILALGGLGVAGMLIVGRRK